MSQRLILQVEDDPNDVALLRFAFASGKRQPAIQVVTDGSEAIDYLSGSGKYADRSQYPVPDLVLLDLKMPKVNGTEVLEWIRRQPELRLLTVIFFSSSYLDPDIRRAYELGANCFLTKPSDMEQLKEIAEFLDDWLRHTRFPPLPQSSNPAAIAPPL